MRYLTMEEVLEIGEEATGKPVQVRDTGLLLAALQRPAQSVFGADAYVHPLDKAAALLHSFTRNHALIDGNKRTGLAAALTFLSMNGVYMGGPLDPDVGEALVLEVAQGKLESIPEIGQRLEEWLR